MAVEFGRPFLDALEQLAYGDAGPLGAGPAGVLLPRSQAQADAAAAREELQRALR
jgi:hypothetical protein